MIDHDEILDALKAGKTDVIKGFQASAKRCEEKFPLGFIENSKEFQKTSISLGAWDQHISAELLKCFIHPSIDIDIEYNSDSQGASYYDSTYTTLNFYEVIDRDTEIDEIKRDLIKIQSVIECSEKLLEKNIKRHKDHLEEQKNLLWKLKEYENGNL